MLAEEGQGAATVVAPSTSAVGRQSVTPTLRGQVAICDVIRSEASCPTVGAEETNPEGKEAPQGCQQTWPVALVLSRARGGFTAISAT